MTDAERVRFVQLENVIGGGIQSFNLVGAALTGIRDEKLFEGGHGTFEEYCLGRWGLRIAPVAVGGHWSI